MARKDDLIEEIERRDGEIPTEGSGKNGSVLVEDLEAVLAELPEVPAGAKGLRRTRNGNFRVIK